jgi:hypothetical protein
MVGTVSLFEDAACLQQETLSLGQSAGITVEVTKVLKGIRQIGSIAGGLLQNFDSPQIQLLRFRQIVAGV